MQVEETCCQQCCRFACTYQSSHRYTVKTLHSKWLYIENKNIIINMSSGVKRGGGGY